MEIHSTPPTWLEIIGWLSLVLAFASLLYIVYDIFARGYRQKMKIMEAVYPITALYFGPVAVWFYHKYGRMKSPKYMEEHNKHRKGGSEDSNDIRWNQVSEAVTHCGAGCTLGDILGEWIVFAFGLALFGKSLYMDYLFDFTLAWTLGILFQYFTIVPMRNPGKLQGIWQAVKVDTASIIAFQIGLFAGMFIYQELLFAHPLAKTTSSYWFLMQLAMILGFFTAYPVNYWLVAKGIKEKM